MNLLDIDTLIAQQTQRADQIAAATLDEYLRPVRERALLVRALEMSPEDRMAIQAAKGPGELARFDREVDRVRGKHGNVG